MTTTAESIAEPAHGRKRSRRGRLIAAAVAGVLVAGGLTGVLTLRHFDHQYGPVQGGEFWGPQSDRGLVFSKSGFSYRLAEKPGATARFVTSLDNLGAHSVRVTAIDPGDVATDIRWSVYRTVPGGYVSGVRTPWHPLPAMVPAQGTIRVLITIHHPADCATLGKVSGGSTATYVGEHKVHWESLLHSHTTTVRFYLGDSGIGVC